MLEKIRLLIDQVAHGDTSKLEAIDMEFEKLVKDGNDAELEDGMKLLEDFLFSESQIGFDDEYKVAS